MTLILESDIERIVKQLKGMDWPKLEGSPELVEHYRQLLIDANNIVFPYPPLEEKYALK